MAFSVYSRSSVGLYRGYSALLFFSIPKNYVRFGTFHFLKENYLTVEDLLILGAYQAEYFLKWTLRRNYGSSSRSDYPGDCENPAHP